MALNDQILDELKKALNKVQATSDSRQTWQEQFDRQPVVSPDYIQAAKAIEGFVGSWAAQANLIEGQNELSTFEQTAADNQPQLVVSHIGRPGVPETNFPLYSWGTNKDDEPAFLGHPISFSIVGPTVRVPSCNWQWLYNYDPATGEEGLELDTIQYNSNAAPDVSDIPQAYGIPAGVAPDGGLYFVVSQTGSPGLLNVAGVLTPGGVGDGFINPGPGPTLRVPIEELPTRAGRYEIFRIKETRANILVLDGNKKLRDYFSIPTSGDPVLRSITMFRPYASRMMAVPSTSQPNGYAKVYLAMTPEKSANGDLLPPYGVVGTPTFTKGTWLDGGFAEYDASLFGDSAFPSRYQDGAALPVFTPKRSGTGALQTNRTVLANGLPFEPGLLKITNYSSLPAVGDVLCVRKVSQLNTNYGVIRTVYEEYGDFSVKHYYEVVGISPGAPTPHIVCRALPQVDPATGRIFYGPTVMDATIDLDHSLFPAVGGIQFFDTGGGATAGVTYQIRVFNDRTHTSNTYSVGPTVGGELPSAIVAGFTALMAADPNVVPAGAVGVDPDVTLPLNSVEQGPEGNAVQVEITLINGPSNVQMRSSGTYLGSNFGQTPGYNSLVQPLLGRGAPAGEYDLRIDYTIHDPVESLYTSTFFDASKVQANRLTNLIDPTWNQKSLSKIRAATSNQAILASGKADKAIFDTTKTAAKGAANPGSLLDLGFRMVLFPAKDSGGDAVPDWDNPITTQNVILDPAINESQYLYIDYQSGAVVCSHTPDPTSPLCTIAPNGIVGTGSNNPRGDIVLFASYVPFSRMPNQTSGGIRLMTKEPVPFPVAQDYINTTVASQDVLGSRSVFNIMGVFNAFNQTLNSQDSNGILYLEDRYGGSPGSTLGSGSLNTITVNTPIATDSLVFTVHRDAYSVSLFTVGGPPATEDEFQIGGTNAITATNLAACINAHSLLSKFYYAISVSSRVLVYTRRVGGSVSSSTLFPYTPSKGNPYQIQKSVPGFILANGLSSVALSSEDNPTLPPSGWVDIIEKGSYEPSLFATNNSGITNRVATFYYGSRSIIRDPATGFLRTRLNNVWGGSVSGSPINLILTQYLAVIRRADVLPNDTNGNTGTSFQQDTTEGFAARFTNVKFEQGTLNYSNGGISIDFGGDFVKKRGDTMSGSLIITVNSVLNPSYANSPALIATGDGTANGIIGGSGPDGDTGVLGVGFPNSGAAGVTGTGGTNATAPSIGGTGVIGNGADNGANPAGRGVEGFGGNGFRGGDGVYGLGGTGAPGSDGVGVWGQGTTRSAGVYGEGARGVVAESNDIVNYAQARLVADGTAVPSAANSQKGDLWVPDDPGIDWDGHLLVYDGTNWLDAYAHITKTATFSSSTGGWYWNGADFTYLSTIPTLDFTLNPVMVQRKFQSAGSLNPMNFVWVFRVPTDYSNDVNNGLPPSGNVLIVKHRSDDIVPTTTYQVSITRNRGGVISVPYNLTLATTYGVTTLITNNFTAATLLAAPWVAPFLQPDDYFYVTVNAVVDTNNLHFYAYDCVIKYLSTFYAAY